MLNLFPISPNDQSIYYLGQIFGMVGGVIPAQTTQGASLIFGVMFKVFNTVALTVGAFVIVYTTVVGLLKTASEGEFLGKHWQSLWVPIRMVMGTAALFPAASGYSLVQIVVMWMVIQGVGAADTLWQSVLNYMNTTQGGVSTSYTPPTSQITPPMEQLFQSLVCQETLRATYSDINYTGTTGNTFYWYCGHGDNGVTGTGICGKTDQDVYNIVDGFAVTGQGTDTITYTMGAGSCGSMTYANPLSTKTAVCQTDPNHSDWGPNSLKCLSYHGQQDALSSIVPIFSAIAKQYVQTDHDYVSFYETPTTPPGGMSGTGQINNSQSVIFTDPNGNQIQPAPWILTYCTTPTTATPPGLGLTQDQCCVIPKPASGATQGCATNSFPLDFLKQSGANNYSETDPKAVSGAYLPFSIQPYLGPNLDFIDAAVNQFVQQGLSGPYATWITMLPPDNLNSVYTQMYNDGWLMAGSYYFTLAKQGQGQVKAASSTFKVKPPSSSDLQPLVDTYMRVSYTSSSMLLNAIGGGGSDGGALDDTGLGNVTPHRDPVAGAKGDMIRQFMANISNNGGQPLVSSSMFGFAMMGTVQFLFISIPLMYGALVAASTFNWISLGIGMTATPWGEAIKAVLQFFTPFYIALLASLFSIGALLGIYVPMVPFIIFTMTAIGWFIATIEAMIAAPIVAIGILSPGGQHELMGKAEASIMIIFNLILRPVLMVLGLIGAMVLSSQIIYFLNVGFARISGDVLRTAGLAEQIIFMSMYVTLFMVVVNKTFSLIYEIPGRALMYIGGHQIGGGEGEAAQQAKGAAEGAASGMSGGAKASGKGAMKGAQQAQKAYQEAQEAEEGEGEELGNEVEGEGEGQEGGGEEGGGEEGGGGEGEEK